MTSGSKALQARDVAIAAAFTLTILTLVLVAQVPHAAGAAQPVRATYAPEGFALSSPLLVGRAYDLVFDDLPPSAPASGYGYGYGGEAYVLHDPDGEPFAASTDVRPDGARPGREQVRFLVTFGAEGAWTLRGGAIDATPFPVELAPPAVPATATWRGATVPFRLEPPLAAWVEYDLTFTGLPASDGGYGYGGYGGYGGNGGYRLVDPSGAVFGGAVAGSPDGAHAGRENATFASLILPVEGEWHLALPSGLRVPFRVGPAPPAVFAAPDAWALPFRTVDAPLAAEGLDDFWRASVTLAFDPDVVDVRASAGSVPHSTVETDVLAPGLLRIRVETTALDVAGDAVLATLHLRSVALLGHADLDLTVETHERMDGSPMETVAQDGGFSTPLWL